MPKIKETPEERKNREFRAEVEMRKVLNGITNADIERVLRISKPTRITRMSNPNTFRLDELRLLCKLLKIPEENMGRFI